MSWKAGTLVVLVAFGATLAYYVVSRLSADALNMAVGMICGMGAGIPVSLGLLLAVLRQRERGTIDETEPADDFRDFHPTVASGNLRPSSPQQPQIIVIAPPQGQYGGAPFPYGFPAGSSAFPQYGQEMNEDVIDSRDWRIIGDDEG